MLYNNEVTRKLFLFHWSNRSFNPSTSVYICCWCPSLLLNQLRFFFSLSLFMVKNSVQYSCCFSQQLPENQFFRTYSCRFFIHFFLLTLLIKTWIKKNPPGFKGKTWWIKTNSLIDLCSLCITMIFPKMFHIVSIQFCMMGQWIVSLNPTCMRWIKNKTKKTIFLWLHSVFDIFFKAPVKMLLNECLKFVSCSF